MGGQYSIRSAKVFLRPVAGNKLANQDKKLVKRTALIGSDTESTDASLAHPGRQAGGDWAGGGQIHGKRQ